MRDVIEVLIIVTLGLQMLTNTVILLGVFAFAIWMIRRAETSTKQVVSPITDVPVPRNPCDHCQTELGDPTTSRIMGENTVLIYTCPKCGLPTEQAV